MSIKDITGKRFGRLVVVKFLGFREYKSSVRRTEWLCRCDCGNSHVTTAKMLVGGSPSSCGCLQKDKVAKANTTHGLSRTKLYKVWTSMKSRCDNKSDKGWNRYGARGIYVCDRWLESFDNFAKDVGIPENGMSLDRIDNNGPYSPENCRWATKSQQGDNTRRTIKITLNGETKSLVAWCREKGVVYTTALSRIKKYGLSYEEALSVNIYPRGSLLSRLL